RIGAVARRYAGNPNPLVSLGALRIDLASRAIHGPEGQIDLSQREWAIFEALLQRPGSIVSKAQMEERLYSFDAEVESNTIEVYVSRLRKKLGRDAVQTLRGLGYRLGRP
ncbi:MAG: winged helix-turn-helix domain-containing protein, partial [Cereibacter changlensis]